MYVIKKHLILLIIVALIFSRVSSQVRHLENIEVPKEILAKYPFFKNEFYKINDQQDDGSEGYFVFIFDKNQLFAFYEQNIRDSLMKFLDQNGFLSDDCWFNLTCDGTTVKKIQGHHLDLVSKYPRTMNDFNILAIDYQYFLRGHYKIWSKYTHVNWYIFGSSICEDRPIVETSDFDLAKADLALKFSFTPFGGTGIRIDQNIIANGTVLWSDCNKPWSTPYTQVRSQQIPFDSPPQVIDFSSFGPIFTAFMVDTKKIKIIEDDTNYYVYCIQKK